MGFCLFVVKRPTNTLWINKNTTSFHATKQIYLTMMSIFMYYFNISKRPKNLRSGSSLESTSTDSQIWRKQTTIFCTRAQLTGFRPMLHNPETSSSQAELIWISSHFLASLKHWVERSYFCSDAQGSLKPYFVALLLISQGDGPNVSMYCFKHQRFQSKYAFCTVEDFWRIIWLLTTFSTFLPM